jgi:hypothetical protein
MRKYRNGKASGEPNRDWRYSQEYLEYRQSRGGESLKVSQCDVDLDGSRDSIISKWRNPANNKVQDCGPPFLFWPPTNISTFQNPGISSQPTAIQILASPQGDRSPTGISIAVDMDEDGHYAGPNNLPPYDFDDNDPNVGLITPLTSASSGPTGINISHPPKSANEGPTAISAQANPQGANSGPTGISIAVDMDEDGAYAGPNNLPPYDFDDGDDSIQAVQPLTSSDSGPTGISLKVDMDEDGHYSDVDTDDLDASIGIIPPLTSSDSGPTGISLKVDMDEDTFYSDTDQDDLDSDVGEVPVPATGSFTVTTASSSLTGGVWEDQYALSMHPDNQNDLGNIWENDNVPNRYIQLVSIRLQLVLHYFWLPTSIRGYHYLNMQTLYVESAWLYNINNSPIAEWSDTLTSLLYTTPDIYGTGVDQRSDDVATSIANNYGLEITSY